MPAACDLTSHMSKQHYGVSQMTKLKARDETLIKIENTTFAIVSIRKVLT